MSDHPQPSLRKILTRDTESELVVGVVETNTIRHSQRFSATIITNYFSSPSKFLHFLPGNLATELAVGNHGEGLGLGLVLAEVLGPHAAQLEVLLALDKQVALSAKIQTLDIGACSLYICCPGDI